MNTLKTLTLILALALIGLATGCTKKADRILGKWQDDTKEMMEFTKDKVIVYPNSGINVIGKWEWMGDNYDRVLLTMAVSADAPTFTTTLEDISFDGDTVTMTSPLNKKPTKYKKVE
jgi:hypothetical protein